MGCGAKKSEEKSGIPAQQNSGERREPTPILFYNSTQYPQYQMETVDNFYCDGRLEKRKAAAAYKAWWSGKMQTQDVEKIRKKRIFCKKSLTFRVRYTIIYIVSYYADRQRHMPASRAGPMPVPIRKIQNREVHEENVPAEEASALQGARLPQAHVHRERPQGTGSPSRKGSR